jgi:hypothetical protein
MIIEPLNYLLGDPSQASTQQVLIKTTDGKPEITTYGAKNATCPVDLVCPLSSMVSYRANMSDSRHNSTRIYQAILIALAFLSTPSMDRSRIVLEIVTQRWACKSQVP